MKKFKMVLVMLAVVLVVGVAPMRAQAQDLSTTRIPSLELDQADIRDALRALFKNVGISYVIAPDVQGQISVSLKDVPFETALQNILKQVDATYRVEGGVYSIIKRPEATNVTQNPTEFTQQPFVVNKIIRKIFIQHADPAFIFAMMRGGGLNFSQKPELTAVGGGATGGGGGGGFGGGGGGGGGGSKGG